MALPSDLYDSAYFLSDCCEGFGEYESGVLSPLKARQVEILAPAPGVRVLDAGCGRGEVLRACAERGADVAGVDYSEAAVEISRETLQEFPTAEVVQGLVESLPWPDAHFDRIVFGDVIEHLDRDQADRALRELGRVLKPGGLLLVHTSPNRLFLDFTWPCVKPLLRLLGFADKARAMDAWIAQSKRYHVNEQSPRSLRRALRRAGFQRANVWLGKDVIRAGEHHLTEGLEQSPVVRLGVRIAALRPFRLFLSNDLFATAQGRP